MRAWPSTRRASASTRTLTSYTGSCACAVARASASAAAGVCAHAAPVVTPTATTATRRSMDLRAYDGAPQSGSGVTIHCVDVCLDLRLRPPGGGRHLLRHGALVHHLVRARARRALGCLELAHVRLDGGDRAGGDGRG